MTSERVDWMWCYENPKDAAAKIERLWAALSDLLADADNLEAASSWDDHREAARQALA